MDRKNLFKKILVGVGLSTSLVAVGVGVVYNVYNDNHYELVKAVEYDDNDYSITLTQGELNNYTWTNLYDYIIDNRGVSHIDSIVYNENYFTQSSPFVFVYADSDLQVQYNIDLVESYHFIYKVNNVATDFEYGCILNIDSMYYTDVKNVIELDIQENYVPMNDSIFTALTNSLSGFITTLSSGITVIITMFYNGSTLTTLGYLATIVVAVALCYFLFRFIMGLIRLRG